MPRFTVAIPGDLLAEAKRAAAKDKTSVNSLIRRLLEAHVRNFQAEMQERLGGMMEQTAAAGVLHRYSRGELPARDAMSAMGVRTREELYAAVLDAGIELPRGDPEAVERQASIAVKMLEGRRLTITTTELRRHFDFIIDVVLPTEGAIYVSYRRKVCAELIAH